MPNKRFYYVGHVTGFMAILARVDYLSWYMSTILSALAIKKKMIYNSRKNVILYVVDSKKENRTIKTTFNVENMLHYQLSQHNTKHMSYTLHSNCVTIICSDLP